MSRIDRRRFVQLSGAGAAAAATGGLAGILASGRAPAYGQTQTVHWLRWADFVPASDQFLKGPGHGLIGAHGHSRAWIRHRDDYVRAGRSRRLLG